MPLQYKNTFLEFVPAVPELKRSKTSPDLTFTLQIEKPIDRFGSVDSEAETECRSSESTEDSLDSPALASQRKQLTGPLWADMTDDDEEPEGDAPLAAPAAVPAAEPTTSRTSWADMTESDDDEVMADAAAEEPTRVAAQETKQPETKEEIDGWTTVVSKKGKKSRR